MEELIRQLNERHCSLVLRDSEGRLHFYDKKGVRDLSAIAKHEPQLLRGAQVADKVVGKAAAGYMALGRVSEVYAAVMSRKAVPVLSAAHIAYSYGELVDGIVIRQGDTRCRLEEIVACVDSPREIVDALEAHFRQMSMARQQ